MAVEPVPTTTITPSSRPVNLSVRFGQVIENPDVVPSESGRVQIIVTNEGDTRYRGPVSVNLYASTDNVLEPIINSIGPGRGAADPLEGVDEKLGVVSRGVNLAPGQSRAFTIDFSEPNIKNPSVVTQSLYYLLADVQPGFPANDPGTADISTDAFLFSVNEPGAGRSLPEPFDTDTSDNFAAQVIAKGDVVLQMNSILLNAIQASGRSDIGATNIFGDVVGTPPPPASRIQAITHIAIYDAINAIDKSHQPYLFTAPEAETTGASKEAAAIEAGYQALVSLFSDEVTYSNAELRATLKAEFDFQRERLLAQIPDGEAKDKGIEIGRRSAEAILTDRADDNAAEIGRRNFEQGDGPYDWRSPDGFSVNGFWGELRPFVISAPEDFAPPELYEFGSDEYAADLNEVQAIGSANSRIRTPEQTEIAQFWAVDRPDSIRPPAHLNDVAQELAFNNSNSLEENARLFALLNLTQADVGITAWYAKYRDTQPRPVQAIRESAAVDGRDDTIADPNWTPLLEPTPPFPDYISGHSTFGGGSAELLRLFFGNEQNFDLRSQDLPGIVRYYNQISDVGLEDAYSRVYGGVHTRAAVENAVATGAGIADFVFNNALINNALI